MWIKWVELNDWCQHEHLKVEFGPGLNGVLGPNGKGKSNFLDAIRYLLTNESHNPGGIADNVRWGSADASVETLMLIGDTEYSLRRVITAKGTTKAKMTWVEGPETLVLTKAKEIQDKLTALLGAPPKVLLEVVLVPQGAIDAILHQDPAERLKEFQRLFGLQGATDAHRLLKDEIDRYPLTPGLSDALGEALGLLEAAKADVSRHGAHVSDLDATIAALSPAEDVLRRADAAKRFEAAFVGAQARVGAAETTLQAAVASLEGARRDLQAVPIEGFQVRVGTLRQRRAEVAVAGAQVARRALLSADLARAEAALLVTPLVTPEVGIAADARVASADAAATTLKNAVAGRRAPMAAETEAQAAEDAARRALNDCRAGVPVAVDPEILGWTSEASRARADISGFETGYCPTCKQVVKGGPAHIAATKATIADLEAKISARTIALTKEHVAEQNDLKSRLDASVLHSATVRNSVQDFLNTELAKATAEATAAHTERDALRAAFDARVALESEIKGLRGSLSALGGLEAPAPGALEALDAEIASIDGALTQHATLGAKVSRAEDAFSGALREKTAAVAALGALGETLGAPSPDDIAAAVTAMAALKATRETRAQAEASLSAAVVSVDMRSRDAQRLAAAVQKEAQDREWVRILTKARDILHPSKLPALAMREYAAVINNQISWYLQKWGVPFQIWINDDLAFRALKSEDGLAAAEMDAARLSGGEKIKASSSLRFAVSDTFARGVGLVVLDEPSNYLDEFSIRDLQRVLLEIKKLSAESHRQVIVVTHEKALINFFDTVVTIGGAPAVAAA